MTIKLIVGPTPVRNMPPPGTTLAPGMWIYWRIAIVRRCAKRANSSATPRASTAGEDVRLLVPTTFMNLSGKAVAAMATFYRINPDEILVAHDELDLPPGVAKFKLGGGHGGHNGLKDIISKLGNNPNFHRLRVGIGHPGDKNKVVGFVLGKPPASEQKLIDDAVDEAARCTEIWLKDGLTKATNRLHAFKAQ